MWQNINIYDLGYLQHFMVLEKLQIKKRLLVRLSPYITFFYTRPNFSGRILPLNSLQAAATALGKVHRCFWSSLCWKIEFCCVLFNQDFYFPVGRGYQLLEISPSLQSVPVCYLPGKAEGADTGLLCRMAQTWPSELSGCCRHRHLRTLISFY